MSQGVSRRAGAGPIESIAVVSSGYPSEFARLGAGAFYSVLMPNAAPRVCTHPGCGALVYDGTGRCLKHRREERKLLDARRGSAHERGYTSRWQKAAAGWLKAHPLCAECEAKGIVEAGEVVDHKIPHRLKEAIDSGDERRIAEARRLFWDDSNWQTLSKACHDRKTAREDGAFGRRPGAVRPS